MCGFSYKIYVDSVRKYVYLVEKYVEGVRYKRKRAATNQGEAFGEKEEKQEKRRTKRRGEPREEENQEKRRTRRTLQSSNLR